MACLKHTGSSWPRPAPETQSFPSGRPTPYRQSASCPVRAFAGTASRGRWVPDRRSLPSPFRKLRPRLKSKSQPSRIQPFARDNRRWRSHRDRQSLPSQTLDGTRATQNGRREVCEPNLPFGIGRRFGHIFTVSLRPKASHAGVFQGSSIHGADHNSHTDGSTPARRRLRPLCARECATAKRMPRAKPAEKFSPVPSLARALFAAWDRAKLNLDRAPAATVTALPCAKSARQFIGIGRCQFRSTHRTPTTRVRAGRETGKV